jgi:hypothetical protein
MMPTRLTVLLLAIPLLCAGCGQKREEKPAAAGQTATAHPSDTTTSVPPSNPQPTSTPAVSQPPSGCPPLPEKSPVEATLKRAMVAIYGTDETTISFPVSGVATKGCNAAEVTYSASGSAASAPLTFEQGQWNLVLFGRHYIVE